MLERYLQRIGYDGPLNTTLETLTGIHRAHATAIPYENLEIQLGRENVLSEDAFFDKLVERGRGGWCYEMNGILTWALRQIGFDVVRVGGAVARKHIGERAIGNHMVGVVDLDRRYITDVGLADGPLDPFPLEEGAWEDGPWRYSLEKLDDGWWRFHNHEHGLAQTFDFTEERRDLNWYQDMCTFLQTSDESPFLNYALSFRRSESGFQGLRDTRHIAASHAGKTEREITSAEDYRTTLAEIIGHDLGAEAVNTLWRKEKTRDAARADDSSS